MKTDKQIHKIGKASCLVLLMLLGLMGSFEAKASHLAGGDIEYKCIGFRKWEIKLVIYRDCGGIPMPGCAGVGQANCTKTLTVKPMAQISAGGLNPPGCTAPIPSIAINLTSYKVEDVGRSLQAICGPLAKNGCDNRGTATPGPYTPSLEGYYYKGILDLSSPAFNNACPYWEVIWEENARNAGTENIQNAGSVSFYISAVINIHYNQGPGNCKNNSPEIRNEAVAIVCSSQEISYNMGAIDPDRDSLTYAIGRSKGQGGAFAPVQAPYGPAYPFPLNSGAPPHTNYPQPNGPYVIIDSITGDISFNALNNHPTNVVFGCINVEITQWNNDVNGNPYVVGRTQRELQVYVKRCPDNNPPKFATIPALANGNPKYNWSVCAGEQLCFKLIAKDIDDGPGPEIPTKEDTTTITWNQGISRPGKLTFVPDYDPNIPSQRPREDRWQFCWQTEESDGATLPYYFTATGIDDNCPNVGRITRAFGITVVPVPEIAGTPEDKTCGTWIYNVRKTKPKQTFSSARLDIAKEPYDYGFSNGSFVTNSTNPNPPATNGNPLAPRLILTDTVKFTKGGKYLVKYTITIPGVEVGQVCTKIGYDTLLVDTQVTAFTQDTLVCKYNSVPIVGSGKWGKLPYSYRWYRTNTLGNPVNGPNFQTNSTYIASDTVTTKYILEVRDIQGCKHYDTANVDVKPLPQPQFSSDSMRICSYESFVLDAGNNSGNISKYEWYKNGALLPTDTTQSVEKNDSGTYMVYLVDSFGCRKNASFQLYVNEPVIANAGIDTAGCPGDSVQLKGSGGQKYRWDRIQGNTLVNVVPYGNKDSLKIGLSPTSFAGSYTDYQLTSYVSYPNPSATYKECKSVDTVRVSTRVFPILTRPDQSNICRSLDTLILPNFLISPASQGQANGGYGIWSYSVRPSALPPSSVIPMLLVDSLANLPLDTFYGSMANNPTGATRTNWIRYTYKGPSNTGGCVKTDSIAVRVFAQPKVEVGPPIQRCINGGIYALNSPVGGHPHTPKDITGRIGIWSVIQGSGLVSSTSGLNTSFSYNPTMSGVNLSPQFNLLSYAYTVNYNTLPQIGTLPCVTTDTLRVNVVNPPLVDAGNDVTVCKNEPLFVITDKSGGSSNTTIPGSTYWTMAAGGIPNISNAIIGGQSFLAQDGSVPSNGGTWKLYYSDTSSGCLSRDSINMSVKKLPQVSLTSAKDSICKTDLTLQLTGLPATGLYAGAGVSNNGLINIQDGQITTETSHRFFYKYTDPFGCSDSNYKDVFVQGPPVLNVPTVAAKCSFATDPFKLSSTVTPSRYGVLWTTNGTGVLSTPGSLNTDYTFTTADAQAQFVMATATSTSTNNICAATSQTIRLDINPNPNADFDYDSSGCEPFTANFRAKGAGVSGSTYEWFFSGNSVSKDSSYDQTFSTWGNVPIKLAVTTPAGCGAEQSGMVRVHAIPVADFESDPPFTTIAKPSFNFNNKSTSPDGSRMTYVWNFGPDPAILNSTVDRLEKEQVNPRNVIFGQQEGRNPVTLIVTTEYGCMDSITDSVRIEPDITVFIPSAFMPKEGGNNVPCADPTFNDCNDVFRVYAAGFETMEVFIFNRWGQQVFSTNNPDIGWNGKINNTGAICPQDVYIYQINATSFSTKKYNYSGSVTLLR
jgi:gliding motility-associated-like protein